MKNNPINVAGIVQSIDVVHEDKTSTTHLSIKLTVQFFLHINKSGCHKPHLNPKITAAEPQVTD